MATNRSNASRLNDDWQYLNETPEPDHATTDQQFNISYENRGMQSISNIRIEKRKDKPKAANDPTFNVNVTTITRDRPVEIKKIDKPKLSIKNLRSRAKANAVTMSIASWYGWAWLIQLVFGIVIIIALAVVATGSEVAGGNAILEFAVKAVDKVTSFFTGYSISEAVEGAFLLSYFVILAVGLLSILTAFIQYTLAGLKPTTGTKGSLKLSMLLIVLIGYSVFTLIPVVNLIPWMGFWALAVWKYPK